MGWTPVEPTPHPGTNPQCETAALMILPGVGMTLSIRVCGANIAHLHFGRVSVSIGTGNDAGSVRLRGKAGGAFLLQEDVRGSHIRIPLPGAHGPRVSVPVATTMGNPHDVFVKLPPGWLP